ncbi:group II intron reverse transcriptase/maturase [Verrucomicrobiota bacterium sgz303538]
MKPQPTQEAPPTLAPLESQKGGEIRSRWEWVEAQVWSERMLAALETGLKGSKWYRLIDKVWSPKNLCCALGKVVRNGGSAGIDHQSVRWVQIRKEEVIAGLEREMREGSYRPLAVRRVWIEKLGSTEKRPLGIPAVRDRIVQGALRHVLEPIFERDFAPQSYGFRPGRSCRQALRRVDELLKSGHWWVVDLDLKSYFDSIPHERLMERVEEKIADGRVLELIRLFLKAGVMESARGWQPTESGTPQGAIISPLLSNIYLDPLDWLMVEHGVEMVRYADDAVILCRTEAEAKAALERVQQWVDEAGLTLHPQKTRIVDASQPGGFDFLGYHFERGMKWPRKKSMERLRETIRAKTRRHNGQSMKAICQSVDRTLRGWFEYFKHSKSNVFPAVDGYVRGRLRSILRRRQKKKGNAHGKDHQRWPNAYFTALGLVSLTQVHRAVCQSS